MRKIYIYMVAFLFSPILFLLFTTKAEANADCYGYHQEGNPYNCGYCSTGAMCDWWAIYKRPDLKVITADQPSAGMVWINRAQAKGYATGTSPQKGAIVVWEGHVAYVEDVYSNGTIKMSEMNCKGSYPVRDPVPFAVNPNSYGGLTFDGYIYESSAALPTIAYPNSSTFANNIFNIALSSSWQDASFEVQIDNSSNFISPEYDYAAQNGGNWSSNTTMRANLPAAGTYYIRAKQKNSNEESPWTAPVTFQVYASKPEMVVYNNTLYQAATNNSNLIQVRSYNTQTSKWSNWTSIGQGTAGQLKMAVYNNKIYLTFRGDLKSWMMTFDGTTWSNAIDLNMNTSGNKVEVVPFNDKLYFFARGTNNFNSSVQIYTRNYDAASDIWTNWTEIPGGSANEIEAEVYDNRLYISTRGDSYLTSGDVYVNSMDLSGNWSGSQNSGITTPAEVNLSVFANKLYQTVHGDDVDAQVWSRSYDSATNTWSTWTAQGITTRYDYVALQDYDNKLFTSVISSDISKVVTKIYDGTTGTSNVQENTAFKARSNVSMVTFDSKLFQAVKSDSGDVLTRYYSNGSWTEWENSNGWSNWVNIVNETTSGTPNTINFNNKMYFFYKNSLNQIHYKTFDGTWSNPASLGTDSTSNVELEIYGGRLYVAVKGNDIIDTNGSWFWMKSTADGVAWTSWEKTNTITGTGDLEMEVYNGKLYQVIRRQNTQVFIRSFDGTTWSSWVYVNDNSTSNVNMLALHNRLYMIITGDTGAVYLKTITDNVTQKAVSINQTARGNVEIEVYNNKLYISYRGGDLIGISSNAWTQSYDGITWSTPVSGTTSSVDIELEVYNNKLYQMIEGDDTGGAYVWVRSLDSTTNTWSGLTALDRRSVSNNEMISFGGKLYMFVKGTDNKLYFRYINN